MKPEPPESLKISSPRDDPQKAGNSEKIYICDRCGFEMITRQCKVICPNCGSRWDCSDLSIYMD